MEKTKKNVIIYVQQMKKNPNIINILNVIKIYVQINFYERLELWGATKVTQQTPVQI